MDELCGFRQISVRCTGFSIVALALVLALMPALVPTAAQAAPAGPGFFAAASTSDGTGQDATATGDGDEEEDVDEWEVDILKVVSGPAPEFAERFLEALGRWAGFGDGGRR